MSTIHEDKLRAQLADAYKKRDSLLGQIRGLTAKAERLEAEVKEARNEAATVRRAYLHEKARAERAIDTLGTEGYGVVANRLEDQAYKGPAEMFCNGKALDPRCTCPPGGATSWASACQFCKGYP